MGRFKLKTKLLKNEDRLSRNELEQALAELASLEKALEEQAKIAMDADPFWHYQPSTGDIDPANREFLLRYLNPEDVPARLDGQLDVHLATTPVIGASGGNQSGKTTVGAIEAFIKATGQVPHALQGVYPQQKLPKSSPQYVRVVGEDYVNGILLNLIPTYRRWAPKDFLLHGTWENSFSSEQSVLHLGHKGTLTGTIEFMSNKQDVGSFQGPPRHKVIYDEEPREDIRKENLLRFTTADALDELYCMTPTKGMTWVYHSLITRCLAGEDQYIKWFQLPSVGNKKANLKVLEEILKGLDSYQEKKMRLLGEVISLSGLVYGRLFDRKVHMVAPFELNPQDWVVYRGLDPHTSKPTVCVEVAVNREGQAVVCGSYKKAADVEEVKADLAARARERHYRLGITRCDKSANSVNKLLNDQNVFLMLKQGENAIPALFESQKFTGSIHAGVERMKVLLREKRDGTGPGLAVMDLPENRPLANSFQTLEREAYANEDERGTRDKIAEGRHDEHAACRYVFQGRPAWVPVHDSAPDYEPASDVTGY